jgi:hypothetical protein
MKTTKRSKPATTKQRAPDGVERLETLRRDIMFAAELVNIIIRQATSGTVVQQKVARALIAEADAGVKMRIQHEFIQRLCGG